MARIDDVKELAEKVMGIETRYYWWDPYIDANAALEVLGAMQRKGWTWNISPCGAKCEVVMSKDGYDPIGCGEGSFCEAICAAALAAVRSEQS